MSRWKIIFGASVIWFFIWIPAICTWGTYPMMWTQRMDFEPRTLEEAKRDFPVHFASLPPSPLARHAGQIEAEDATKVIEFDPIDWAMREMRYRWFIAYLLFVVSGFVINWICWRIVSGHRTWEAA